MAHEYMHFINDARSGTEGYIAIKLDMSKAYDRLEWYYVEKILVKLGFA